MKKLIFILSVLPALALARLGETPDEAVARYGADLPLPKDHTPLDPRLGVKVFTSAGFGIVVIFFDGKSASESYEKEDKSEISDIEIETLLAANGAEKRWKKSDSSRLATRIWDREDNNASAGYNDFKKELHVIASDFLQYQAEREAEKKKDNLKGF